MQAIDRKSSKNVMRQGNVHLNLILDNESSWFVTDLISFVYIFIGSVVICRMIHIPT